MYAVYENPQKDPGAKHFCNLSPRAHVNTKTWPGATGAGMVAPNENAADNKTPGNGALLIHPDDRPGISFGGMHAHHVQKRPYAAPWGACSPGAPKRAPARGRGGLGRVAPGGHNESKNVALHRVLGYTTLAPCLGIRPDTFCSAARTLPGRASPYPTTPEFGGGRATRRSSLHRPGHDFHIRDRVVGGRIKR